MNSQFNFIHNQPAFAYKTHAVTGPSWWSPPPRRFYHLLTQWFLFLCLQCIAYLLARLEYLTVIRIIWMTFIIMCIDKMHFPFKLTQRQQQAQQNITINKIAPTTIPAIAASVHTKSACRLGWGIEEQNYMKQFTTKYRDPCII